MTYEEIAAVHPGAQAEEIQRHEELFEAYLKNHPLPEDASDAEREARLEEAARYAAQIFDDLDWL